MVPIQTVSPTIIQQRAKLSWQTKECYLPVYCFEKNISQPNRTEEQDLSSLAL
jgi:hypothetical protein